MASNCKTGLNSSIKRIGKELKRALVQDDPDAPEILKTYSEQAFDDIQDFLKQGLKADGEPMTKLQMTQAIKRQIIDTLNTYKAGVNSIKSFDAITAKAETSSGVTGGIKTFFQNVFQNIGAEKVQFDHMVDRIFQTLETGGVRFNPKAAAKSYEFFYDAISGGQKLSDHLRDLGDTNPNKTIYMALKQGTSKIPELDMIARAVKTIDSLNTARVKKFAPYFNILEHHVLPIRLDPGKLNATNKDAFNQFLLEKLDRRKADGTELTDAQVLKKADAIYSKIYDNLSFKPNGSYRSTTRLFGHRKLHFKNSEAEYDFLHQFGRSPRNILQEVMKHKRQLSMSTALYNILGPNVGFNLKVLERHAQTKFGKIADSDNITKTILAEAQDLEVTMGHSAPVDTVTGHVFRAIKNLISYGLTGSATVRDLVNDKTVYTGLMRSFYTGENQLQHTTGAMWDVTKASVKNGRTQELADLLHTQGIMIRFEQALLYQGYIDDALGEGLQASGKGVKFAKAAEKFTARGRQIVSRYSGADRVNTAGRASQAVVAGDIIMTNLKQPWGKLNNNVKSLITQTGLGQKEWEVLAKVDTIKFEGKDLMPDSRKVLELSDSAVEKLRRPLETAREAKIRLHYGYQQIQTELINHLATITSKRGQIRIKTQNDIANGLINTALSFTGIANSQWYNLHRAVRARAGLDPNAAGGINLSYLQLMSSHPTAFAKVLGTQVAGGMLILWAQDLMLGKTPRDMTPANLALAVVAAGAGGMIAFAWQMLQYSRGNIGTPLEAFIAPVAQSVEAVKKGNVEGVKRNLSKVGKHWIPGANMWWTKYAYKKAMQEAFNIHPTSAEKRLDREIGRKDLTD